MAGLSKKHQSEMKIHIDAIFTSCQNGLRLIGAESSEDIKKRLTSIRNYVLALEDYIERSMEHQ